MTTRLSTAALLGLVVAATAHAQDSDPEPATLHEALAAGTSWVKLRLRLESVDQDGITKDATAFTLRTLLGYETGAWNGFSALLEAEDVSPIVNADYNDTLNMEPRPVIADPNGTEVNQAFLQYSGFEDFTIRAGRQRIILADARFVGNVGWRQNEQTFDAWSVETEAGGVDLYYAHVTNVNRVFGEDSPGGDHPMASNIFHAGYDFGGVGRLEGFLYDLDYDDQADFGSTRTVGASFAGSQELDDGMNLLYRLAFADQSDAHDNPTQVDAGYLNLEAGLELRGWTVKVGQEVLEGSGNPGDKFTTPLATGHKFNGWADQFLGTPDAGLEDTYLSLSTTLAETKLALVWHEFQSDAGGLDYGDELDLIATRKLCEGVDGGIKFADYSADTHSSDTQKVWLWVSFAF